MVDIEECSLRTFKQDFLAPFDRTMEIHHGIGHERPQIFAGCEIAFVDLAKTNWFRAERLQDSVVLDNFGLQFF